METERLVFVEIHVNSFMETWNFCYYIKYRIWVKRCVTGTDRKTFIVNVNYIIIAFCLHIATVKPQLSGLVGTRQNSLDIQASR